MEKKTRKRSKKDEPAGDELSDSEKEIHEEEPKKEDKKEEIATPNIGSPTKKKKKKKDKASSEAKAHGEKGTENQAKGKEDVVAVAPASPLSPRKGKEDVVAVAPSSPLSPRKGKKEPEIVSPRRNTIAMGEDARKRSESMVSDHFEEVLDVGDEEGLTDDQVYISKVLRGIRKGAMYGETLGKLKREEKEDEPTGVEGFARRDYKDKVVFKFNSPTPAGSRIPLMKKDKVVIMTDYAPRIFFDIRRKCNVPTEDYLRSWTFPKENLPSPNLGAGRSGSLFVSSSDSRFIFKTIPDFEVDTLLEILPSLHQHFVDHPQSRIIRFLGLHHFYDTITKEETHCIVMNNLLLHPSYSIDEKWDLKGRIPKPGKEGRFADKVDRSKKVLKDNDLLDRRFHLTEEVREDLLKTLNSDVEFLKTHNCMDYSLLVGVHFLKDGENEADEHDGGDQKAKEEKKSKKGKKGKKKSKKNAEEAEGEEEEREPALLEGVMDPLHSDPAFRREIYFVGIIDPLSRYKLRKKVAHFLKEIIWDADTLSTVPADYYAERYSKYLAEIFVHRKPEEAAAAAPVAAAAPAEAAPAAAATAAAGKEEKEAKPEGEENKEAPKEVSKKGTLKREKKNKKEKTGGEEEAVTVVATVAKDDEEPVVVVDSAAPVVAGKEVEIKVEETPKKEEKRDGTLKRKKKAKKAAEEAAAAENGDSGERKAESGNTSATSVETPEQPPATQAAPEVEIKVEGTPKREKKNKKDGTLKREKKSKNKE